MFSIDEAKKTIDNLKQQKAVLEGQKQQFEAQIQENIMPKFAELGITPDQLEAAIAVEQAEVVKLSAELNRITSELSKVA